MAVFSSLLRDEGDAAVVVVDDALHSLKVLPVSERTESAARVMERAPPLPAFVSHLVNVAPVMANDLPFLTILLSTAASPLLRVMEVNVVEDVVNASLSVAISSSASSSSVMEENVLPSSLRIPSVESIDGFSRFWRGCTGAYDSL